MKWEKQALIICPTAAGQMYLGILLNRIWYAPVLAATPDEGIGLARKTPFSLILLDGDIGGAGLLQAVSAIKSDLLLGTQPLVVFLSESDATQREALVARGCSAILTKPLDLSIVFGVLARLCGQPRTTLRIPVNMRVEIEEETPEKVLSSVNLSEGGIFLRTPKLLPEGARLHIRFTLPHDAEEIALVAEVAHVYPLGAQLEIEPGIGLRFLDIPEYTLMKIRNFIQWETMGDLDWQSNI